MARAFLSGVQIPTLPSLNIDGGLTLDAQTGTSGQILTSAGGGTPTWNSSISISGDIITTAGKLQSTASAGDEGGEIFLNKSVTNTTLNGGVTIDVYQNKLRFFEQGGTARGYYIDISGGGAGVATNLVSGGSYTLPAATSTVLGGIELFSDTVQSTAANSVTTTASRTYGLQLNSSGQAVVNVPWTDTDTNYYPSAIVFNAGTTAGPTLDLTMSGSGAPDLTAVAIPSAGASASGIVTTGSQTFAGAKTFTGTVKANDSGWINASSAPDIYSATGWVIDSCQYRRVNGMLNGTISVQRSGTAITVPSTGNITNSTIATLPTGFFGTSYSTGIVLSAITGPLIGGYIDTSGNIIITAASAGATIATNAFFSFTFYMMLD
jgi:hypothetical protein